MKRLSNIWVKAVIGAVALFSFTGASAAYAAYWTISQEYVSDHGAWSEWGSPNTKQSNSNYASFNGDVLPNWSGYQAWLINSNGESRSGRIGLQVDVTTRASGNSGLPGYSYWADIRSAWNEPNGSTVKVHFSADWN